ncbi:MAG: uroporphyrinogen-III synthase [Alphaproteobacteria bacterium]
MNKTPLILLTRPQAESQIIADILQAKGYLTFIEPMLTLKGLPYVQPDWNKYAGLILTSLHALHGIKGNPDIPVYIVGKRSADAAKEKGFKNIQAVGPVVDFLIAALKKQKDDKPFLYLRGKNVTAPLHVLLPHLKIEDQIVYDMQPVSAFSPECLKLLRGNQVDATLFFSRRSAQNFMDLALKAQLFPAFHRIKALCLGAGMLECLSAASWGGIHEAETPDQAGILKKLYDVRGLGNGHDQQ